MLTHAMLLPLNVPVAMPSNSQILSKHVESLPRRCTLLALSHQKRRSSRNRWPPTSPARSGAGRLVRASGVSQREGETWPPPNNKYQALSTQSVFSSQTTTPTIQTTTPTYPSVLPKNKHPQNLCKTVLCCLDVARMCCQCDTSSKT